MKRNIWIVFSFALLTIPAVLAIVVVPASARVASAQAVEKSKDAVVKGAKVVGEKTKDGLSKTGEVMTDGWITTRVHERMVGEDLLKGSDINVDTDKHVVTLRGTVTGRAGRSRATTIAIGTEGVHRVVNHLIIGPKHSN
jgi:hyperosmotically inducible protein